MILYFVRHGQSVANVERVVSNRGFQHPLTELGMQQAQELVERLQDVDIARIYTSPLQRAVQTAEILASTKYVEYEVADALCEGDCGILEGRSDADCWTMMADVNREWFEKGNRDACIEEGESFNAIVARFVPFVQGLVDRYGHTDQSILLVSHGSTLMVGLSEILNNVDLPYIVEKSICNACYIKVKVTDDGFQCIEWTGEILSGG